MAVAKVIHTVCDLCGSDRGVSPATIKYEDAWELDLCAKCYKSRFADLEKIGRKPTRRKRRSFEIVEPL